MLEVHSTRLFPVGLGADAYQITGIASRCDWVVLTDVAAPRAHLVRQTDTDSPAHIFLSMRGQSGALTHFAANVLPLLNAPFILVSGSEDVTLPRQIDQRFPSYGTAERQAIDTILDHPLLIRWVAENLDDASHPKLKPLPLGLVFSDVPKIRRWIDVPDAPPTSSRPLKVLCAHRVRDGRQWEQRKEVSQLARTDWAGFCTLIEDELSEPEFLELCRQHAFVLCVEGGGLDPSPKAWQAILQGAIPIVRRTALHDAYRRLPVAFTPSWNRNAFREAHLEKWLHTLAPRHDRAANRKETLRRLGLDYWWSYVEGVSEPSQARRERPMPDKTELESAIEQSKTLGAGAENYRAYVGPPKQYDFMGATQFALLFMLGLREEHDVLDVGCGSLRAGRLLLQFLMPGRYVGVEPNSWLWRNALSSEIGEDIARLKAPHFVEDDSFSLTEIGRAFDFVMFQSVLSHTGGDMFDRPLHQAAKVLKPRGQLLFTVLDESTHNFGRLKRGNAAPGWHYPTCVTYEQDDVLARCRAAGLHAEKLPWFHPRQSWYRGVIDETFMLTEEERTHLGTGRPLFDERFD